MHFRSQLRGAIANALSGLSANYFEEQAHRLGIDDLPAVVLYLDSEQTDDGLRTQAPAYGVERLQNVRFEIHATGNTGLAVAVAVDALELEIESAIADDAGIGAIVELLSLDSTDMEYNTEQDRVLGVRTVNYTATVRHPFGSPDQPEG